MTKQSGVPDSGRVLKPSNDTTRVARSLAFPPGTPNSPALETGVASELGSQPLSAAVVESAIHERALRWTFVPAQLLTDSAWDMLLELIHSEITKRRVTSSILCKAAGVPASVGRRWIDALAAKGLCTRRDDAGDPDAVELTMRGSEAMRGYFSELANRSE